MADSKPLGLKRVEAIHYYVRDLARARSFYTEEMDFAETAASTEDQERDSGQRTAVFEAADVRVVVSEPLGEQGRAAHYLARHPDGVGTVVFEVEDAEKAFEVLEARGGTPTSDPTTYEDAGGTLKTFAITTPFGDTLFRFVERRGYHAPYPGLVHHETPKGGGNRFGFTHVDHLTSNFLTMKPMLLWMEEVMGWEPFWDVSFHTQDVAKTPKEGSGLRSVVMWDPHSGIKFANNEPWRPHFQDSQIYRFVADNRGEGIQHAALATEDLVTTVRGLRERGVSFMPTPGSYYDMLPARLDKMGIGRLDEDLDVLRELEILVDGEGKHSYLIQIFVKDFAGLYGEEKAGPFFYELIQRKGDQGFGAGNFRALFESIEREQTQGRKG